MTYQRNLLAILLILVLSACAPVTVPAPVITETPTTVSGLSLPDLVVASINVAMVDSSGRCVDGYQVFTSILNQGNAPAENITAVEMATGHTIIIGRLEAGQKMDLQIPAAPANGTYLVNVDPQNVVPESNETNNNLSYLLPTPTPYVDCAPTPVLDVTPTLPPFSPQATPSPISNAGLIYADMNRAEILQAFSFGEPAVLLQSTSAQFSPDGSQALFERSGDLWLAEPMDNPGGNITDTPDRMEQSPQWLPGSNPKKIVFNSAVPTDGTVMPSFYLTMMNLDGSDYKVLASTPSYTIPALHPGGQDIAYDENGKPMGYAIGRETYPFEPQRFGYQPAPGVLFTSPSWSPDGRWLTWWVSEENGASRKFDLVMFDHTGAGAYKIVYSYTPLAGTQGWLPNPVWSPGGQWIAFQTRGETTPWDLWVVHRDGGIGQRFGLASNPVWSPDSQHLAYLQDQPNSDSYLASSLNVIDIPSWNVQQTSLPPGSIPVAWFAK